MADFSSNRSFDMRQISFKVFDFDYLLMNSSWEEIIFSPSIMFEYGDIDDGETYYFVGDFQYYIDADGSFTTLVGTSYSIEYNWYYHDYDDNGEFQNYFSGGWSLSNASVPLDYFTSAYSSAQLSEQIFIGDDRIYGRSGDDYLMGYKGNDLLYGGDGNDTLDGGGDEDVMIGGRGDDTYVLNNTRDIVWEYAGEGTDTILSSVSYKIPDNVENLTLTGTWGRTVTGNDLSNVIQGNSGNNTLLGGGGSDRILGGAGNDVIEGGDGNDQIYGQGGDDHLRGNLGSDRLFGGAGADVLLGGAGADRFSFKSTSDSTVQVRDVILDFSRKQGDKIDLAPIDARENVSGNQGFTFIGTAKFTKRSGELRYETKLEKTFIYADVNGDGKTDFSLLLDKGWNLRADDFML